MRDNFLNATKEILAKRVSWRCSYPGCGLITVGPGHENEYSVVNLGEAAHIYAASEEGPRFNSGMTSEERKSIENGIWMCRHHARLIDADFINYSPETLKQWKILAEKYAYSGLQNLERDIHHGDAYTLVAIGPEIIFLGEWKAAIEDSWIFVIKNFIKGDINKLREYNDIPLSDYNRYIVVETQGDGRLLMGKLKWEQKDQMYEITIRTAPKSERTTPYRLGSMDANFTLVNGSIRLVRGIESAKQAITTTLSTDFGELVFAEDFGSHFSSYYWSFKDEPLMLKRLLKLEITRLLSIPYSDTSNTKARPPFQYINRVLDIEIINIDLDINNRIVISIKLEWGDGKYWEDILKIYVRPKEKIGKKMLDSFEDSGLSEELFNRMKSEIRGSKK